MDIIIAIVIFVVAFKLVGGVFFRGGARISYELERIDTRDVQGEMTGADFEGYGGLTDSVSNLLSQFACPSCGSTKVGGSAVVVRYGKVRLHRQETYTGWFGGTKYRDVHHKTVWRVHEIGLKPGREGGFFSSAVAPGTLECRAKECGWKEQAPVLSGPSLSESLGIRWCSLNDMMHGKPRRRD